MPFWTKLKASLKANNPAGLGYSRLSLSLGERNMGKDEKIIISGLGQKISTKCYCMSGLLDPRTSLGFKHNRSQTQSASSIPVKSRTPLAW